MTMNHTHIGSSLDDVLKEQGVYDEVNAGALKRVIACHITEDMRRRTLTTSALAKQVNTSRMTVDRLLDASQHSVTLTTLGRVASVFGRRLVVTVV